MTPHFMLLQKAAVKGAAAARDQAIGNALEACTLLQELAAARGPDQLESVLRVRFDSDGLNGMAHSWPSCGH